MGTKFKIFFIGMLISVTMVYSKCKPIICSDAISYHFQTDSARVYPDKDSIRVGDTLWLKIDFPTKFQDLLTNQVIDYSNAGNLGEDVGFITFRYRNAADSGIFKANENFDCFILKGSSTQTIDGIRNFLFSESNGHYLLKIGFIARNIGLYGLGIGNPTGIYRKNDVCTKASLNISFANTDQHYYLNPFYQQGMILPNSYYFKVY